MPELPRRWTQTSCVAQLLDIPRCSMTLLLCDLDLLFKVIGGQLLFLFMDSGSSTIQDDMVIKLQSDAPLFLLFYFKNNYAPQWCNMTFTAGNLFPSHSSIGWHESSTHWDSNLGLQQERQMTCQLSYFSPWCSSPRTWMGSFFSDFDLLKVTGSHHGFFFFLW